MAQDATYLVGRFLNQFSQMLKINKWIINTIIDN
jgi:hypothetical protein